MGEMTRCMWNPRYDRPSLGGEGDCAGEAVWEVGRKNILKLCERCVGLRPFVKWEKRRIHITRRAMALREKEENEKTETALGERLDALEAVVKRIDGQMTLQQSSFLELDDELCEKGIIE